MADEAGNIFWYNKRWFDYTGLPFEEAKQWGTRRGALIGLSATGGVITSAGLVLAGTFAFASLGLFLAGVLRAEATLAAANLVYLLLLAGGAVVLPASSYGALGSFVQWLPSGALGEASRAALTDGLFPAVELVVLLAWGALGTVLTARTFSWE